MKITGDDIINTRKKFDLNRQDFAILADIDISHLIFFEKHHHKTIINPYFIEVATKILSATSLALFPNYHCTWTKFVNLGDSAKNITKLLPPAKSY